MICVTIHHVLLVYLNHGILVNCGICFTVLQISVDPIRDLDEWQTTPGYCILVFRMVIMLYFLYELQDTFAKEDSPFKRNFYSRFGAGFLAWFIYLPIVALVSPKIAALWRYKTLLSELAS